jgi:hypothetical protein
MNDFVALSVIRGQASEARSARPDAPVVDDAAGVRHSGDTLRRSLATTLRITAAVERRLADRLDPAVCTPVAARG